MSAWVSPFHLSSFSKTTVRGGHVDAESQCLGGEHGLAQAAHEELLHAFLEHRQHAGVMGGDSPAQAIKEVVVAEDMQVLLRQMLAGLVHELMDLVAFLDGR